MPNTNNSLAGKTLCLVNTSTPNKQFVFETLKKLGLTIVVINKEKNWAEPYVDHWIITDTANNEKSLKDFKDFLKKNSKVKIDGIMTICEEEVVLTSMLVEKFNFLGTPYSITEHIRNKLAFRYFCKKNDLPVPKHHIIKTVKDLNFVVKNFKFPVVIKPAFGAGSAYVTKVKKAKDLHTTATKIKKAINRETEIALANGLDLFVEEFLDGDEVDIDILLQNGKIKFCSVTDNEDKTFGDSFLDKGQSIPSLLSEKKQMDLVAMTEVTLEKLGNTDGIVHYEAKYTKRGPMPLEINLRLGGGCVFRSLELGWGISFVEYGAYIALGEYFPPIQKPKNLLQYVISSNLQSPHYGKLIELKIDPALRKKSYLKDLFFSKKVGDEVFCPPHGFDTIGWFTVIGKTLKEARKNAAEAKKMISYSIQPTKTT